MLQLKDDIISFLQLMQHIDSLKMKNYCWPSLLFHVRVITGDIRCPGKLLHVV